MSRYFDDGQYDLVKLTLKTNTSNPVELDIMPLMVDMTIYESIYTNTLSGNISLIEAYNLVNEYSLGNGETIEVQYNTAGIDTVTKHRFVVYKLSEPTRISEHSTGHVFYFMSEEAINSMRKRQFGGYTAEISTIVSSIYDNIKRGFEPKPLEVSDTRNIHNFVFTGNEAFMAIQMLSNQAISKTDDVGYVFFEDSEKFRFVSIEELFQQQPVIEYAYKNSSVFEEIHKRNEESFNAYQAFDILPANNYTERMNEGLYGGSWARFSILDKNLQIVNYNVRDNYVKEKSLASSPLPIDNNYNDSFSDKLFLTYGLEQNDGFNPYVNSRMTKLRSSNFTVSIGAFGDSTLKVGMVCKANIPNWSSNSMEPTNPDRDIYTGKFLIAEIKHTFTQKLYTQRIKIIKDAYEETTA